MLIFVAVIAIYLLLVNGFTFLAFATDKHCAETKQRRIPEVTLLFLATIGGTGGAIAGQKIVRHKTRKQPFCSRLNRIADVQIVGLVLFSLFSIPGVRAAVFGLGD